MWAQILIENASLLTVAMSVIFSYCNIEGCSKYCEPDIRSIRVVNYALDLFWQLILKH